MMPGDPVKWVSVLVGKCIRRGGSGVEWGGDACIAPVPCQKSRVRGMPPRRGGSGVERGGDACIAPVRDHFTPPFLVEVPLNVNYVIAML